MPKTTKPWLITEYKCTCHVYGQIHKYRNKITKQTQQDEMERWFSATVRYGQIHKKN